jgi:hypothetical protein
MGAALLIDIGGKQPNNGLPVGVRLHQIGISADAQTIAGAALAASSGHRSSAVQQIWRQATAQSGL